MFVIFKIIEHINKGDSLYGICKESDFERL